VDVIGSSPVGPTVTNGGSELPNNPEAFEDEQGNPDWANAGREVLRSKVSSEQLDETELDGAAEANPAPGKYSKQKNNLVKFAIAGTSGLLAFSIATIAPSALLELSPVDYRQSIWIYFGLVVGGLVATFLQIRSRSGFFPASASVFGVHGAKAVLLIVLISLGIVAGATMPSLELGEADTAHLLVAAGLILSGVLAARRVILQLAVTIIGLGYLAFAVAQSGTTFSFSTAQFQPGNTLDLGAIVLGFTISMGIQILIAMPLSLRLAVSFAGPLALALFDLSTSSERANQQTVVILLAAILVVQLLPQLLEMNYGRTKSLLFQIAALALLAGGLVVGVLFSVTIGNLLSAAALVSGVWALIQIPSVFARRLVLHRKSLALSYGFYPPISVAGVVSLLFVVSALAVAAWLNVPLPWILAGSVAALLLGFAALPGFLRSQADHLAAEKRKNEPVRVSSEDLQWSD
jgi:hypothetical protein